METVPRIVMMETAKYLATDGKYYCEECGKEVDEGYHRHEQTIQIPVCDKCNRTMVNVNTINGERIFGCTTWDCTNRALYVEGGKKRGDRS